jgi:cytosine/uracil/thiamine/allantoin permease
MASHARPPPPKRHSFDQFLTILLSSCVMPEPGTIHIEETATDAALDQPWNVIVHNDPINLMSYVTLVFLSVSLPPIGGIIISDFYLRCKARYPDPAQHAFKHINWAAMAAWASAICVSVISPADGIFSIAPLNAILTAMFAYVLFYKLIYRNEGAALSRSYP